MENLEKSARWVRYEIKKSHEKGNGIFGVYIHNLGDKDGNADKKGTNSFVKIDETQYFWELYPSYNWDKDNGYENFSRWI